MTLGRSPKLSKFLLGQSKLWFRNNEISCSRCIQCIYSRCLVMPKTWSIENVTVDVGRARAGWVWSCPQLGNVVWEEEHLVVGTPVWWTTPLPSKLMSPSLLIFLLLIILISLAGEFGRFRQNWGIYSPPIPGDGSQPAKNRNHENVEKGEMMGNLKET